MLNKLLIIFALILFGATMYIAGLSSPENVRTKVESWLPGSAGKTPELEG